MRSLDRECMVSGMHTSDSNDAAHHKDDALGFSTKDLLYSVPIRELMHRVVRCGPVAAIKCSSQPRDHCAPPLCILVPHLLHRRGICGVFRFLT